MSFNFDSKIREKMARFDRTDTSASNESKTKTRQVPGAHVSFSDDDVKRLQKKREKDGLCISCGEVKTHKKMLMRMVPETVHGVVYQGICLRCNPSPNIKGCRLTYSNLRLGWERTVRATDFKFRWKHSPEPSNNCLNAAYVRKVEFFSGNGDGPRVGRVSLVAAEDSVSESMVEYADGCTLVSFRDIEVAQKMKLESKKQWFYGVCTRLRMESEGQVLINVRQTHILEDSIKAVLSLGQDDLRKKLVVVRDNEVGEMSTATWYASVIDEIFSSDAGLWQKSANDETRMDVNFLRDMVGHEHRGGDSKFDGDLLTLKVREYVSDRFRFIGRLLGKALLDGELVPRLAKHIYMLILGLPIKLDDVKDLDLQYDIYLVSLLKMFSPPKYDTNSVARESRVTSKDLDAGVSGLGLNFTISEVKVSGLEDMVPLAPNGLGLIDMVPLVPNGDLIAVEDENLIEYINACIRYRFFGRHEVQLESFILGFLEVVPEPLLAVFDSQELEVLLCGSYTGGKTAREGEDRMDSFSEHEISTMTMSTGNEQPLNAIVKLLPRRTESSSSRSATLPEALLVDDQLLYDAIAEPMETVPSISKLDASEVRYRLKKGRCLKCGMQTHKATGVLKKNLYPLSNENVLNGRCLICNPLDADIWKHTENERTSISNFPHPPPTAPSFPSPHYAFETCLSPSEPGDKQQQEVGEAKQASNDKSRHDVEQWLLSHLPSLQKQDVEKYGESLVEDGFDSIAMMEHLEEEDLSFMKKAHSRALMKIL